MFVPLRNMLIYILLQLLIIQYISSERTYSKWEIHLLTKPIVAKIYTTKGGQEFYLFILVHINVQGFLVSILVLVVNSAFSIFNILLNIPGILKIYISYSGVLWIVIK